MKRKHQNSISYKDDKDALLQLAMTLEHNDQQLYSQQSSIFIQVMHMSSWH
ncbi:hypothetical protein PPL_08393 [Heterostelium album PN500]|uniref:Uncharacterized protein n=1 Tax=Heterostelium pallidum (strain ATCC 26659 / Pp 5 / PN500) TaxID=670386 RepID=D3BI25_HETP5|nr:hypothetical protein PPL_08393 [Heterostelium album PN500]EFA78925.1 hypothetical protein PPL_08393 [Heterostelium album PN500]|eukprot:XP_020431049.1 hypothetical protein PPL_08393 [Heterostelium album PN500]